MVQVTGSLGTWVADRLKLKGEDFRTLSLAGMAAGFTALFGAPLGGAFFALEILHHQHVLSTTKPSYQQLSLVAPVI
jgi:H+/Cl- antiporter ClcA